MKISGIYTITCLVNNKIYIGYAKDIFKRKKEHFVDLKRNKHYNNHLQKAYNFYKKENFLFEILEECDEKYLASQEHYWCNLLNTHNRNYGYNVAATNPYKNTGKMSDETKLKISTSLKGKKVPKEATLKTIKTRKAIYTERGYFLTEKGRSNMIDKLKKRIMSEENKNKVSIFMKGNKYRLNKKPPKHAIENSKLKTMKKIDVFDLEGLYIKTVESISEFAREIKTDPTTLIAVLKGRQKQSKGYQIKYFQHEKLCKSIKK